MYKVKCYDDGWVTMCKLVRQADGELDWEYCKWDSREDAQREADAYKEAWGRSAYVVEAQEGEHHEDEQLQSDIHHQEEWS